MDINSILLIISSIVCVALSVRAFYIYSLTQSDAVFIAGASLGIVGVAIFFGYLNVVHLGDLTLYVSWLWYIGTSIGVLFIFLSSLMKSQEQMRLLRRWQVFSALLYLLVILLVPIFPSTADPLGIALLNLVRTAIGVCAFVRYTSLYISKETRFSLAMSLAFLLLSVGFGMVTPQLLIHGQTVLAVAGTTLRLSGYATIFIAYTLIK